MQEACTLSHAFVPSKYQEHGTGDAEPGPEGEAVTALQDGTIG